MKYLWHSSALKYLIEIECFDDVSSLLDKDTNLVDYNTVSPDLKNSQMIEYYNIFGKAGLLDLKKSKIVQYYTLDKEDVDYTICKKYKGGSFGEEPDGIHVFVKAMEKYYNIVISYPPVLNAYREKLGNRCKTVFDIIKLLYDAKKLTDEILYKIMNSHENKFKDGNPTSVPKIQAYKYLHNKYLELQQMRSNR